MNPPRLGPVLGGTLNVPDLAASVAAYGEELDLAVHHEGAVGAADAEAWGCPALAGAPQAWLANALGEPWLRLVQGGARSFRPFRDAGWLALEISVESANRLGERLGGGAFEVIGPPRDLDVSDRIRALQVTGLAGEVLYLTRVAGEVPPFELPRARCAVDRLFIPVLLTPDREASLAFYERLCGQAGLRFETLITVLNRARGWPEDRRHPVATLQLAGATLIEMDEVGELPPRSADEAGLPPGIAMISMAVAELPPDTPGRTLADGPWAGRRAARVAGAAGEWIELIEGNDLSTNSKPTNLKPTNPKPPEEDP